MVTLATPTGLSATGGTNQVSLKWNVSTYATGYNVKRSTTSGSGYAILAAGTNVSGTSFTDTTALPLDRTADGAHTIQLRATDKAGNVSYQAPLAKRQLLGVAGVEMTGDDQASVTYNWKWVPDALGDSFDAGGPLVKSFNMWERQTLISKYQVDFYHGDATTSTLTLVRQNREWKLPAR